jgi:non-homologous end joining protein Ku
MGGRGYLVGIKAHGKKGLMLSILRYAQELRDETPYFDLVTGMAEPEAVALITKQSGKFEPKTMPNQFTAAVKGYSAPGGAARAGGDNREKRKARPPGHQHYGRAQEEHSSGGPHESCILGT